MDEDDSDEDMLAQKLNEQLLEDIRRAREAAATAPAPLPNTPKEDAALTTMKTVLALAEADPAVQSILASTLIPGAPNENVLTALSKFVSEGRISQQMAGPLSQVLVALAK